MTIGEKYAVIKSDISLYRDKIIESLEPGSIEDSLCKGFSIWYSELAHKPKFLLFGINPNAGYFKNTKEKFRDNDLEPSDEFEYGVYGGKLAEETISVFKSANKYLDLERSVKLNIHYLVTANQKDLNLLQGILIDKYNINMYKKAEEWTRQLINIIEPEYILCEGAYPSRKISEYYNRKIEWINNVCDFEIDGGRRVIGYKRLFSKILNKKGLTDSISKLK